MSRRAVRQVERCRTGRRGQSRLRAAVLTVPVATALLAWSPVRLPGGDTVTELSARAGSSGPGGAAMAPLTSDPASPHRKEATARAARPSPSVTREVSSSPAAARSPAPSVPRGVRAAEQTLTDLAYAATSSAQ